MLQIKLSNPRLFNITKADITLNFFNSVFCFKTQFTSPFE